MNIGKRGRREGIDQMIGREREKSRKGGEEQKNRKIDWKGKKEESIGEEYWKGRRRR